MSRGNGSNGNGRKPVPRLTPELHAKLVAAIGMGAYDHVAAQAAGVDLEHYYAWLRRGRAAQTGVHRAFYEAIQAATATAELDAVAAWRGHWETDWRAAAAYLERKHPDRWSKTDKLLVRGALDHMHRTELGLADADAPATFTELGLDAGKVDALGRALAQAESGRLPPPPQEKATEDA